MHLLAKDRLEEKSLPMEPPVQAQALIEPRDLKRLRRDCASLLFVWTGTFAHKIGSTRSVLKNGAMLLLPSGLKWEMEGANACLATIVQYHPESFVDDLRAFSDCEALISLFFRQVETEQPLPVEVGVLNIEKDIEALRSDINDLLTEQEQEAPSHFYLRMTFLRLLHRCARNMESAVVSSPKETPSDVKYLLAAVEKALHERIPFDLKNVAMQVGYSSRQIARRFRQHIGTTPQGFFQKRRIQIASRLLLDSQRRITDVAYELGFADGPHFTRAFREEKGVCPRMFRKYYVDGVTDGADHGLPDQKFITYV